jgi:DNA-binding NarL/FixJ family response regulator
VSAALARSPAGLPAGTAWLRDAVVSASQFPRPGAPSLDAVWRALTDGRYRLVECFERSGWRHYVLEEDPQGASAGSCLTAREKRLAEAVGHGESEKVVAFALGVTPSAASALLRSVLLKLGLRSKMDLVHFVNALCPEGL